jgi:hypothetical protein
MRYYAQYNESSELIAIGTGLGGVEITQDEYNAMLEMICAKAALVDQVYSGENTISDVPEEWQEEIQRRVDERIAAEGEAAQQAVSGDEFMAMFEEVL